MKQCHWYNPLFFLVLMYGLGIGALSNDRTDPAQLFVLQSDHLKTVDINKEFSSGNEEEGFSFPLQENNAIYGASVNAQVNLRGDAGLARVILVDNEGFEYLIYETYTLIAETRHFEVQNACDETNLLAGITPAAIRIELSGASITLQKLNFVQNTSYSSDEIRSRQSILREAQILRKIDLINSHIKTRGFEWVAGETERSGFSYAQKKQLFNYNGLCANLQGYEFYSDGVFYVNSNEPKKVEEPVSTVVDTFAWKDRHGITDSKSPYFNGDKLGRGWCSLFQNQGSCGSCYAHDAVAAAEIYGNLYYNKSIDMNLSETMVMQCSDAGFTPGKGCGGGYPLKAMSFIANRGAIDEAAFPYTGKDDKPCGDSSKTPKENFKVATGPLLNSVPTEDSLKRMHIHYGPLGCTIKSLSHCMPMVGYKKGTGNQLVIVFKDSYSQKGKNSGFNLVTLKNISDLNAIGAFIPTVSSKIYTKDSIRCVDLDKDGYYNWGIGPKPATCPSTTKEEDCDDSRNDLGPMEADGSCKKIATNTKFVSVVETPVFSATAYKSYPRLITIKIQALQHSKIQLAIYSLSGSLIKTLGELKSQNGLYVAEWNGINEAGKFVSKGTYICTVLLGNSLNKERHTFKICVH